MIPLTDDNLPNHDDQRQKVLDTIIERKKMDAYVEHRLKDLKVCAICGQISYRKTPMKKIGGRWVCFNCLKELKETLDELDMWEEEIALEKDMTRQFDEGMGI